MAGDKVEAPASTLPTPEVLRHDLPRFLDCDRKGHDVVAGWFMDSTLGVWCQTCQDAGEENEILSIEIPEGT